MNVNGISISSERIAALCRANGIRRLALFGPVLRDGASPERPVDVWVEFQPGMRVGLTSQQLQHRLSAMMGHDVHLTTPDQLTDYYRRELGRETRDIYHAQ